MNLFARDLSDYGGTARKERESRLIQALIMDHLDQLENQSIYILREAHYHFDDLCMLWSVGKDSTVMLWLARRAFFGRVPFPIVHIDTTFKIPAMIPFRDRLARELNLTLIVGTNVKAVQARQTFPDGAVSRMACCRLLKTEALKRTLSGRHPRSRLNRRTGQLEPDPDSRPYTGVIAGVRADEEGSRSKERWFSPRDKNSDWHVGDQPPEFWNQFNTDFAPGTHVRIHPLLDWTELNVWEYIARERIPVTPLYFDQGTGHRYRSLGCAACTKPVESRARTAADIVAELRDGKFAHVAERSGRDQDREDGGGLETLRREGYM